MLKKITTTDTDDGDMRKASRSSRTFLSLPFYFWIAVIFLSAVKLWLVSGQHMSALAYETYDDRLFLNLANNLIHFDWLGTYNNLTLAKGPFYPIWIALSYFVHVPLFFSQHILYIFACIILVVTLRPFFEKKWPSLVLFTVLLFNPMSFADGPATRVLREGIYPALTMLVVAFFIGILLHSKSSLKKITLWSLSAGIALSCFWLTREEGIWILPFAVLISFYSIFVIWKEKKNNWKIKVVLVVLPFIMLYASVTAVSGVNYYKYGIFNTVEFKDPVFLNAYGALTRVKAPVWMSDVAVSTAQRQIIYSVSPAFSELKPFFEGDLGKQRAKDAPANEPGEIRGGWFMWAFRDAVAQAGTKVIPVYRLRNLSSGDHIYTTSEAGKDFLENDPNSPAVEEGIAFYAYPDASFDKASVPIYRISDASNNFYFSTSPSIESNSSVAGSEPSSLESVAFYAYSFGRDGTSPVYDFKITGTSKHFYTISNDEKDTIIKTIPSFAFNGIAFYAYPQSFGTYYTDGKLVTEYYKSLADEVNSACDSGKISCFGGRSTMMPPWNARYDFPTLATIFRGLSYTSTFSGFSATPSASIGDADSLALFNTVTGGDVTAKEDLSRVSLLNNIGELYIYFAPLLAILSVLIFLFQLIKIKKSYKDPKFVLSFLIASSFFARIVGLALIDVTSFPAIGIMYLSPLYPLLLVFFVLNFSAVFSLFKFKSHT